MICSHCFEPAGTRRPDARPSAAGPNTSVCGRSCAGGNSADRPRASASHWASSAVGSTVSARLGAGLPSSRDSVSRSLTSACMRADCAAMSRRWLARSASVSGRLCMVSMKPASTVSGVRISCDTLATKSRRMASACASAVTSRDSISRCPSP